MRWQKSVLVAAGDTPLGCAEMPQKLVKLALAAVTIPGCVGVGWLFRGCGYLGLFVFPDCS